MEKVRRFLWMHHGFEDVSAPAGRRRARALALALVAALLLACLSACGKGEDVKDDGDGGGGEDRPVVSGGIDGNTGLPDELPSLDALTYGDYTDLQADIQLITHRQDLDGVAFRRYIEDFQRMYPGVQVAMVRLDDYENEIEALLERPDGYDLCTIPRDGLAPSALPLYFAPLGESKALGAQYRGVWDKEYEGVAYGIPAAMDVPGIVYNTRIWQDAGITGLAKTPSEFLAALRQIRDRTHASPLYLGADCGWMLNLWSRFSISAAGRADYLYSQMPKERDPFVNRGDGTGLYEIYNLLYHAVKEGLVELDSFQSSWTNAKTFLDNGNAAALASGALGLREIQDTGAHGGDLALLPFPITENGKQIAAMTPDYCYGINKAAPLNNQLAALLLLQFLLQSSHDDVNRGGIPVYKANGTGAVLENFKDVSIVDFEMPAENEGLFSRVNEASGLLLGMNSEETKRVINAALSGVETADGVLSDWNSRWNRAAELVG